MSTPLLQPSPLRPLAAQSQRLAIWQQIQGLWKHRALDPLEELHAMRREWERPMPPPGE